MPSAVHIASGKVREIFALDDERLLLVASDRISTFDEPCKAIEHVVHGQKRVRKRDSLGRGVGDVALVPERDVLEPDQRVAAHQPRKPADPLGNDRVSLVRHRRRSLLAAAERLLHFSDLGPCQVPDLDGEAIE